MARNRNEKQFDEYRDWQWIKHLILRNYGFKWSVILGPTNREIVVVDTCAGAANYTDPDTGEIISEGSPVIFGRRAKAYTEENGPGRSMRVICCERNRNNYKSLVEVMRPFQPHVKTFQGGFWRHVPTIAEELRDSPALILLDPIGVAAIPSDKWRAFLERSAKTDIFVVLHFAGVHRTGGWLLSDGEPNPDIAPARRGALNLDRVFNTRTWRDIAVNPTLVGEEHREARERLYMKLFFDHVIGDRHEWKCYCPVRAKYSSPVKYWLVHASNSRKAYAVMNDEIVEVNEILLKREHASEGQLEGFLEADVAAHHSHIAGQIEDSVYEYLRAEPTGALPYGAIEDKLLRRFFGLAKLNVHWRVLKGLVKHDKLLREKNKGAKADLLEKISLPGPALTEGEVADVVPIRRVA
jgi:three-Cys-motif partner protein